jgi:hypothetical protein
MMTTPGNVKERPSWHVGTPWWISSEILALLRRVMICVMRRISHSAAGQRCGKTVRPQQAKYRVMIKPRRAGELDREGLYLGKIPANIRRAG